MNSLPLIKRTVHCLIQAIISVRYTNSNLKTDINNAK